MTATEKAKRSDALYYETVSVNRRVLCDMIANREADLEDAMESVKRLMTQRDERLARAEAENAKLRELVRDMAECMDDSQPRCKKCKFRELNCQWFKFDDRMRELGVEVDA